MSADVEFPDPDRLSTLLLAFADNNRAYADIIRAEAEYIRMLGEARLQWARARLIEAQAAHELEEVRKLRLLTDRLKYELKQLGREEFAKRQQIARIEKATQQLNSLTSGTCSHQAFLSMRSLFSWVVSPKTVAESFGTPVEPFPAEDFISNLGEETVAFPGGTLGQLINFVERHHFSFDPYKKPHLAVLIGITAIGQEAAIKVKEYQEYMQAIRKGTLNLWNPPAPPKPADKPTP